MKTIDANIDVMLSVIAKIVNVSSLIRRNRRTNRGDAKCLQKRWLHSVRQEANVFQIDWTTHYYMYIVQVNWLISLFASLHSDKWLFHQPQPQHALQIITKAHVPNECVLIGIFRIYVKIGLKLCISNKQLSI